MKLLSRLALVALASFVLPLSAPAADATPKKLPSPTWVDWSPAVFTRAQSEKKLVLLDLGARWCHWCHVMEEMTYANAEVIQLLERHFICVHVDQDSRPDLANRYEDYGWPATIFFGPKGEELVKRQGFINPREMLALLRALIDDPTPGPSVRPEPKIDPAREAALPAPLRAELEAAFLEGYDAKYGSWGRVQKFLDWDNVERCLSLARRGDENARKMAQQTLDAQRALLDPAWGGVYQYSTDGDWEHPHFEKIMQMQAENLRVYALAFSQWQRPSDLASARAIESYLRNFLSSPEGAFYVSQDADLVPGQHAEDYFALDDAGRRRRGLPRIDTNLYSRENGWAILAYADLYAATGEEPVLARALQAARWVLAERALPGGGFRHGATDEGYLGDTLAMGRAFLRLYALTADRVWLERAQAACGFIDQNFRTPVGFAAARPAPGGIAPPKPQLDENVQLARLANLLARYTGDEAARRVAEHALKYALVPEVWRPRFSSVGGILMAEAEFNAAPLHIVIVGRKSDPTARELHRAALRIASNYVQLEWYDATEPKPLETEIPFPESDKPAAYVCTDRSCSPPIEDPAKFGAQIERITARK
ncbi:MAG: thioredoxin domain-containing protein [Verrucomicrobia bacterium]|nr:thioredoxin domain-containing protein [Verrucomicrobiota bacterium]